MKPSISANTPQLRETRIHGNSMFPFMIYDLQTDPSFEERINCHWHEEVEILVITGGCAKLYLNDEEFTVTAGSICFIPSNALHLVTCEIGSELSFFALVFHPDLLCGLGSDLIRQKYLKPLFRQGVRFCSAPTQGNGSVQTFAQTLNNDSSQHIASPHDSVSSTDIATMQENVSMQQSAPAQNSASTQPVVSPHDSASATDIAVMQENDSTQQSAPAQNSDFTQPVASPHGSASATDIAAMQENGTMPQSVQTQKKDSSPDFVSAQNFNLLSGTYPAQDSVEAQSSTFSRVINPHIFWEYELRKTLDEIYNTFTAKEYGYELFIKASLLKVCHLLVTHAATDPLSDQPDTGYHTGLIRSVMQYLQDNFNNSVTLSELEQHFHISQGHLCRSFKAVTRMTPFEYLNYYRISKSMEMLMDTDEEIGQIALRTGFNNISYFNRTFQRFVHMTPRAYRQSIHHT